MNQLKFNVKNQIITRTDHFQVVADSKNYLNAEFVFTDEWNGEKIIAIFGHDGNYYQVELIDNVCLVPWEVIKAPSFSVSLFCDNLITANIVKVGVEKSGFTDDGQIPGTPTPTIFEKYIEELDERFKKTVEESIPPKATEEQANEGNDDLAYMTPAKSKQQFNYLIASALTDTPEIYTKESIEGMNSITGMKHGDMCIILSGTSSAQSIYRYYTKDINGNELSSPQWVWLTDLSLFAPMPVLELTEDFNDSYPTFVWDYSLGNSAKITFIDEPTGIEELRITNVFSGAYGTIDVYHSPGGSLKFEDGTYYSFPPDWDYLVPNANQHYRYSFYFDGYKFDWSRSVRENV